MQKTSAFSDAAAAQSSDCLLARWGRYCDLKLFRAQNTRLTNASVALTLDKNMPFPIWALKVAPSSSVVPPQEYHERVSNPAGV